MDAASTGTDQEKYMHIFEHLKELRRRLMICLVTFAVFFIVSYVFYDYVVDLVTQFYANISSDGTNKLFMNSIIEGLTTKLKISLVMGLVITMPVVTFNIVAFVFPALKRKEKRYVGIILVCSFFLIILSIYLSYAKILPVSIMFLTDSGLIPDDVGLLLNYNTNIFYVLSFMLWSIIAFQTPLIFLLLMVFNVIKRKTAFKLSRYIVVLIFVVAAVVTPPDLVSQVGLALPLVLFYFLAILIAKIFKFGE